MKLLRHPFVILCLVIVLAGVGYWYMSHPGSAGRGDVSPADPKSIEEAMVLAIKGISLMQGEQGFEYWRLKAEWAGLHQENDVVDVQQPRVRYTLGDGTTEDYVYAVSDLGKITDQQKVLTMWQNVRVTHKEDVITGPRLVYNMTDRTMRFPDGAKVDNVSAEGTFGTLTWRMDANCIDGDGGIDVLFKAREPEQEDPA